MYQGSNAKFAICNEWTADDLVRGCWKPTIEDFKLNLQSESESEFQ